MSGTGSADATGKKDHEALRGIGTVMRISRSRVIDCLGIVFVDFRSIYDIFSGIYLLNFTSKIIKFFI